MMFTRQRWRTADKTKHREILRAIIVKNGNADIGGGNRALLHPY
jgi:hypothetical protein